MAKKSQQSTHVRRPWSIASLLRKEQRDWFRSNDLRRRLRHHWFDREVLKEASIRFGMLSAHGFACIGSCAWAASPRTGLLAIGPHGCRRATQLLHFALECAGHSAVLVYPFIIAFVALLLDRRPSSKAFLQIYLVDSGGLAAGLSSLFLVLSMAVQYVMLSTSYRLGRPCTWVAVDSVWFVYNVVLTIWFLFRTVEFLRPDFQMEVVKRYAANVALPREIANLLRFQFFATAQKKGWTPGPEYLDDAFKGQPQVVMHSFGFNMGEVSVERYLPERSRLTNVFYWPLRLAIAGWLKKASKQPPAQASGPLDKSKSRLLVLPVLPGSTYEAEVVLARVDGGPKVLTIAARVCSDEFLVHASSP